MNTVYRVPSPEGPHLGRPQAQDLQESWGGTPVVSGMDFLANPERWELGIHDILFGEIKEK